MKVMANVPEQRIEPYQHAAYNPISSSFFQLTLSSTNKIEIFSEALTGLQKSHNLTCVILENLRRWNPEAASQFTLRSTSTVLSTFFRLIYPQSNLASFDATGFYPRQFIAVSYCWRSPDFLPDGYERHDVWPIKKSLVDAILAEKPHPRVGIWIDQMCIDQSSEVDKKTSVAAMDIIYRSCLRLVVLLEDVLLTEEEIELVQKYNIVNRHFNGGWKFESDEIGTFASFYKKVDAARWWSRAWCHHEFCVHQPWLQRRKSQALFHAIFILCGPDDTTVKLRWGDLQMLMGSARNALPDAPIWHKGAATVAGGQEPEFEETGPRGSIMARHNVITELGSTFLADRLSIIINLCGIGLAYSGPPIDTKEELLYLSSLLALAAGETYPLSMMDEQSTLLKGQPTWMSKHEGLDVTLPGFDIKTLKGIHRIDEREIKLDMVFLDASWVSVKDTDLQCTYDIFPTTIPTTDTTPTVPSTNIPLTHGYIWSDTEMDLPRRRFLAGCILNGWAFTGRMWEQIKRDILPRYNTGHPAYHLLPNPSFRPAAQSFIAHLVPVSTLLGIVHLSESDLSDATLFLTWLTDIRSVYYVGHYTFRVPCTKGWDSTFVTSVTVNEQYHDGPDRELYAAIPSDLVGTTCIHPRVWILRPKRGEERKWRVVGKGMMLGEPDLLRAVEGKGGAGKVSSREGVVVGG